MIEEAPDRRTSEAGAGKSNGPGISPEPLRSATPSRAYFTVIVTFMPSATCGRQ